MESSISLESAEDMRGSDAGTETPLLSKAGELSKSSPATTGNLDGYPGSATESDSHEQSGGSSKHCADVQAPEHDPPGHQEPFRKILVEEKGHKRRGAKNTGLELRSTDTSLMETRERGTTSTSRKTSPTGNLDRAVIAAHKKGHVVLHQAEPAAAHTADLQEDQPYRDPPQNTDSVPNVESLPHENTRLPRPISTGSLNDDDQSRGHNHRRSIRRGSWPSESKSAVGNEHSIKPDVAAEDKSIGDASSYSSRSNSPDGFWSNAPSSNDTRFSHSTSGTSPRPSEYHFPMDQDPSRFRRRASPGVGQYVNEREWYYLEKNEEHVAKPRESHLERGRKPRSVEVRRQTYDDHPTTSQRRISRERQSEVPRIPRRVTAYTEPWHDLGDGQLAGRSVEYKRTRRYDRENRIARRRDVYADDEIWIPNSAKFSFPQTPMALNTTSLGGVADTRSTTKIIDRIITIILYTNGLPQIDSTALGDPRIESERYRTGIHRIIETFGMELRNEARSEVEIRAAIDLQIWSFSTQVARGITNDNQQGETFMESAEEGQVAPQDGCEDEANAKRFILGSKAYVRFKASSFALVHESYEERIMSALSRDLPQELCQGQVSLTQTARRLSWVPTSLIHFSHERSLGTSDRVKDFIEDTMGERWNWSPLEDRNHRLQAGCIRLSWKSPHGVTEHVDLPERVKVDLQGAFKTAPAFINQVSLCDTTVKPAGGTTAAGSTSAPSLTLPSPSYQGGGGTSSTPVAGPQIPMQQPGSRSHVTPSSVQQSGLGGQSSHNNHYIYLCVEADTRTFLGLNCTGVHTDVEFFKKIKSEYDSARGWFRLWLSTWRYDHCEFMQFQKTGIGLGARLQIAFPEPTDPLYDYLPKPLESLQLPPHGPISADEFRLHYYYQICPSLLSWERWHRRRTGLSLVEKEAFDAAPKRVVMLDMRNGRREKFYGLYAKEARSALRVAIHMSVCCLPGVVFFFLWLYQWGHGADLQGAAVPVQLSLTLVAGYLGVLYWTR